MYCMFIDERSCKFFLLYFRIEIHGSVRTPRTVLFLLTLRLWSGKFIQCSRIPTILSASEIRQEDIRLRSQLSDGSQSIRCHKNCVSKYVSPSSLAKLGKRGNDTDKPEDSKTGRKRLSSSTSAILHFVCSAKA